MKKIEIKEFDNSSEMIRYLTDRSIISGGAVTLFWQSEYGFTIATQPLKLFPDDELDNFRGDFNYDWSNSDLPELLKEYDKDAFWYWWSWD